MHHGDPGGADLGGLGLAPALEEGFANLNAVGEPPSAAEEHRVARHACHLREDERSAWDLISHAVDVGQRGCHLTQHPVSLHADDFASEEQAA